MNLLEMQRESAERALATHSKPQPTEEPTEAPKAKKERPKKGLTCFADIETEEIEWLIKPYIPLGCITILQGDPGTGKTALACKLAASVTTGTDFAGYPCQQGSVLLLSAEDNPEQVLKKRLEADGADINKCFFLEEVADLRFGDPRIEEAIDNLKPKLVVFDPIQLFLTGDMNSANQTRPILTKVGEMARDKQVAILLISHINKSKGVQVIHKAIGSMDIVGIARSMLHVGFNPQDPEERIIAQVKCSMERNGASLAYVIGEKGKVTIKGKSNLTAEDVNVAYRRSTTGIAYADEPLVRIYRQLMAETNNVGGRYSFDALAEHSQRILGSVPFTNWNCKSKTEQLAEELMKIDHILAQPYRSSSERGIEIRPVRMTEFQTRLQ